MAQERNGLFNSSGRRTFIKTAAGITGGLMSGALPLGAGPVSGRTTADNPPSSMPTVDLFGHSVTRMLVGANPFWGWGHRGKLLTQFLQQYHTIDRIVETLHACERAGINTWQTNYDKKFHEVWTRFRDEGGTMNLVLLYDHRETTVETLASYKPVAILHHGNVTDDLFREGRISVVSDFIKKVHDCGLPAGPSTHNPMVVEYCVEKNWDVDIFQTCMYVQSRTRDEWKKILGFKPLHEMYPDTDPERMCRAIRSTDKPCLAFKILAAGRIADRPEDRERAFRFAFENIKPGDCIIVGIMSAFGDQTAENVGYVRKYAVRA